MLAAAQVIDAVAARLSGATPAGTNVFTSRMWPLEKTGLPAWRVYAGDEAIEETGLGDDRIHEHNLDVQADAVVSATADIDDAMNAMAVAGLPAIFALPVPFDLVQTGVTRLMGREGQADVGMLTLNLRANYYTRPTDPETIISS